MTRCNHGHPAKGQAFKLSCSKYIHWPRILGGQLTNDRSYVIKEIAVKWVTYSCVKEIKKIQASTELTWLVQVHCTLLCSFKWWSYIAHFKFQSSNIIYGHFVYFYSSSLRVKSILCNGSWNGWIRSMLLLICIDAMFYWFDFKAVIVTHDCREQRCSAGNNMFSSDIVWPNFENAWPIAHYAWTWWLNISPTHLELSSSRCYQSMNFVQSNLWNVGPKGWFVNEFCPVKFVKCWTKRMIWKDIILCPVNKENSFSSTGDGSMYCIWGVFFAFKFSK